MRAHILLVEDEPMLKRIVGTLLSDAGHTVSSVGTAEQALKRLEEDRIDLVLSDKNLPGLDGIGLLQKMRERDAQRGEHHPFLLATGYPTRQSALQVIQSNGDGYLVKPFRSLDATVALVEETLRTERAQRRATCALAGQVVAHLSGQTQVFPPRCGVGTFITNERKREETEQALKEAQVWVPRDALATHQGPAALVSDDIDALEALRSAREDAALIYLDNRAPFADLLRLIQARGCAVMLSEPVSDA